MAALAAFVGVIALCAAMFVGWAWIVMILMGALHASVSANIPAVGFGGACIIAATITVLSGVPFARSSK